uniref:Secreted protein n=1 Tax=Heterorhabditis bacteriophora TaxID=37862 RepID=A0A1I7X250_HETBA
MFSQLDLLVEVLFCLSSCLIGISLTALYIKLPPLMLPDKCYKVILSMCALFYSIQDVDTGLEMSGWRLIWVSTAAILQFYEVRAFVINIKISAIFHFKSITYNIRSQFRSALRRRCCGGITESSRESHLGRSYFHKVSKICCNVNSIHFHASKWDFRVNTIMTVTNNTMLMCDQLIGNF